ncbi:protein ALWAYS EARLY 3-like isoform X2 [Humulus lupulus]|uniref:protein ALWAYS EARLY 3-like isoform X2 n=1 Tax=Humulus lupulus TaxID=3486 RepID=UPI002B414514|nr:protein ALWAYS EARLY 3-like isoform X2 [Humulus lupulus]
MLRKLRKFSMAPSRKSRNGNKQLSNVNEVSPNKHGETVNRSRQKKRKLSDMLGPQWSKRELERFYEAYRKYGKDWRKVASAIRNRSAEMVEALYSMNRAYLSLPDGTASVAGLVAMMTDHYCVLGVSDSDEESNGAGGEFHEPQKGTRGKSHNITYKGSDRTLPDLSHFHSATSHNGCLPLLKRRRSGIIPHAVRKRTPRFDVSDADKDSRDANSDAVHKLAMVMTEASQRSGSPHVSWRPNRKIEAGTPSPHQDGGRMFARPEMSGGKLRHAKVDDSASGFSIGNTETNNKDYEKPRNHLMGRKGAGTENGQEKGKNYYVKKLEDEDNVNDQLDDIEEDCIGTEKQKFNAKGRIQTEVVNVKSPRSISKDPRKRSRNSLYEGDEDSPFDALVTLANTSLMMREETADTVCDVEDTTFRASKLGKSKGGGPEFNAGIQKSKQKSSPSKIHENRPQVDFHQSDNQKIEINDKEKRLVCKGKRSSHTSTSLQRKLVKPLVLTYSESSFKGKVNNSVLLTREVHPPNQLNIPTKARSRRKMNKQKPFITKDVKKTEKDLDDRPNLHISLFGNGSLNLKEKLSTCLHQYQARRWCAFEWFYSAIDYPWFAKSEFVEYLNHVGLGHVTRLTRVEWGVIRSSLGRPRRFSEQFLKEEKEKLNLYRESVRAHYAELRAGTSEGLSTDLARPLSVQQRVISIHPRTREIHDGTVLTVDDSRYHVQFDRPDLGVEYVMDIDCMPLNPMENLPASFTRHNDCFETFNVCKINKQPKEGKTDEYVKVVSIGNVDNNGNFYTSPSTHDICEGLRQKEGYASRSDLQAKVASYKTTTPQNKTNFQPSPLAQMRAKEADVQAISELTRALDKKEAVVFELRRMNDDVLEKEKNGDSSLKNSETFKKHYAAVLLQFDEVNKQVSSALLALRKRNTYQGISPLAGLNDPECRSSSADFCLYNIQDCGSQVAEIVDTSEMKARKMVGTAMQAMSSLEKTGINLMSFGEAAVFVKNRLSEEDLDMPAMRSSSTYRDKVKAYPEQSPGASTPSATCHAPDLELNGLFNQNEPKVPSELIASCLATLLMIKRCTERPFPPAEIARVLDSAVTTLQPRCSQNRSAYEEIQRLMGIIRTKILALVPT